MSQRLLITAQLLVLAALALALQFLLNTTGGTLFVFATFAPMLVTVAVLLFAGVAFQNYRRRQSLFNIEVFEPGQIVFHEGDPGDCAYFLRSGEVEVLREENGQLSTVATLTEGAYFGETALLADEPRNATIRAKTEVKLAVLGKENFVTMLNLIPTVHEDVMKTAQERTMKAAAP